MQLLVLAALTLTTSLLRAPHGGARTMPPATAARAATAVASADDDLALELERKGGGDTIDAIPTIAFSFVNQVIHNPHHRLCLRQPGHT